MQANIVFEDVHRINLIQKLIDRVNARSYLEIGCDRNQIFDIIKCDRMVGVDPTRGGTLRMTSDEYFKNYSETFDVIFIDGLHHYDQVTRDVNNALKVLNAGGYIVIHDMLPTVIDEISMPDPIISIISKYWLGDVWRLGFDLMGRNDITFKILAMDCGCGVVTKIAQQPNAITHVNSWEWYCDNWNKLPFVKYDEIFYYPIKK
jgi:SAM-dependent methyltransferase